MPKKLTPEERAFISIALMKLVSRNRSDNPNSFIPERKEMALRACS
jgi:hypothetical protein